MNRVRWTLGLAAIAVALVLLPSLPELIATCGGGGGGGRGGMRPPPNPGGGGAPPAPPKVYNTSWAGSIDGALGSIKESKGGVAIYFQAKDEGLHGMFKSKVMSELSQKHKFVKIEYRKDDTQRETYGIDDKYHWVHVVDWFGNSVAAFKATLGSRFPLATIQATIESVDKLVERALKAFKKDLKKTKKYLDKKQYEKAAKYLAPIVAWKGHEICEAAKEDWTPIQELIDQDFEEALGKEKERDKVKALRKVKSRWRDVQQVQNRADREISELIGVAPSKNGHEERSLVERIWDEEIGSRNWDVSLAMRVDRVMNEGLEAELAEKYEVALEKYALAAGLDIDDPIPLIYLGELHRHHLGKWDEAKKIFQRVLDLDNDDFAVAIALHGIGKMTIWGGDNQKGLDYFAKSIQRQPTALCYRNLAVFWHSEGDYKKALGYAEKAYALAEHDPYNQLFYAVYLQIGGRADEAKKLAEAAEFDSSMSYNLACYYAARGERDQVMKYLRKHFYEYEKYDAVRRFEMLEARMDINFVAYLEDPEFQEITQLAEH